MNYLFLLALPYYEIDRGFGGRLLKLLVLYFLVLEVEFLPSYSLCLWT
ncbi:hypothetical protein Nhal_2621 [Nitrosococcus halophilus Nc 4]|uniref:Uncharacterized protein n=1 Tax=Nitrosococcus halophilus (strain Nc4) TaxID=472759 RepID=D5BWP0_NITHN|nr:hypothetical protein Nhal_2621 [Nitrosococcus halophilus Nc 4]